MRRSNHVRRVGSRRRIMIIGGGIMEPVAAVLLKRWLRRFQIRVDITVVEAETFGGERKPLTANLRCQRWLHSQGTSYAGTQPTVALALQRSTMLLQRLVTDALAVAVDRPSESPSAADFFRVLGIDHQRIPHAVFWKWFPTVCVSYGCRLYRVADGTIDLRLRAAGLRQRALRCGVRLVRGAVTRLLICHDRIHGLHIDRKVLDIRNADHVVFAYGANLCPLLEGAGLTVPGFRHFVSQFVATAQLVIRGLFPVLRGANFVPHEGLDGEMVNVFGNTCRSERPSKEDIHTLQTDQAAGRRLLADVEEELGIRVPDGCLAWPAVKTESVRQGIHFQVHRAFRIRELRNAWSVLPGKLSQSAACAEDLTAKLVRELLDEGVTRPFWDAVGQKHRLRNADSPLVTGETR